MSTKETYTERLIDITGCDVRQFIKEVYNLSVPIGLGVLHERHGELDEETVDRVLTSENGVCHFNMDYVHGRCCKMRVRKTAPDDTEGMFIRDGWMDHTQHDLETLLQRCGIKYEPKEYVGVFKD